MRLKDCTEHSRFQLALEQGENVIETLTDFCERRKIKSGVLWGLGAVRNSEIGFYNLETKEYIFKTYPDDREVVSLVGNIAIVDEKPFVHAHISLGDKDMNMVGGHLKECVVAVTLEIHLTTFNEHFNRTYNENIGLNLLDL